MDLWGRGKGGRNIKTRAGQGEGPRAAHFVFLLFEFLLQIELLGLQVIDALPQFLGLLPVPREWGGGKDGPPLAFALILTQQTPGATQEAF